MPIFNSAAAAAIPSLSLNDVLVLEGHSGSFALGQGASRIGSNAVCELLLPSGPALHSVIHRQADVSWIEAEDDASLMINGCVRRRIALRDGDVLDFEGNQFTVRLQDAVVANLDGDEAAEDLTALSAEELCDRILSEQSMIDEFEEGQRAGWRSLTAAVAATRVTNDCAPPHPPHAEYPVITNDSPDDCERLLEQIHELSDMMDGRTQELDDCESELIAATALLQEAQERVSNQLEALLSQLNASTETELRASA